MTIVNNALGHCERLQEKGQRAFYLRHNPWIDLVNDFIPPVLNIYS